MAQDRAKYLEAQRRYRDSGKKSATSRRYRLANGEKISVWHNHRNAELRQDPAWLEKEQARQRECKRKHYHRHKVIISERNRIRKTNWHQERVDLYWNDQQGLCAICQQPMIRESGKTAGHKSMECDHDHRTDHPRGLLCGKCNKGLGHFNDDRKLMRRAIAYLQGWEG